MWPFNRKTEMANARIEPTLYASSPENPSTSLANPADWMLDWASGSVPHGWGPRVSERTAMCVSAVYRCVTLRSGIVAGLPLKIYKRTPTGREEAPQHALQSFFQMSPYPGRAMTSFVWRELWGINVDLWGDHVSIIRYDGAGRIVGFEPVMPWDIEVYQINKRNVYRCAIVDTTLGVSNEGGLTQRIEWHDQEDIVHIPGPGFNGVRGMSRIRAFARNTISLAMLLEEQTGRIHENSARPSGLATVPPGISRESFDRFKAQFSEQNVGRANAGRVVFGDKDTTYTPFQMSQEDLNTLEFRRFQVADISRFYGVPLHLLNETEKSTSWGTGLSEQTLGLLIYTVDPELGRIEAELNYKLFFGTDYYIEFDRDALMAMDPLKAAQVAQAEISTGTLLINERRRHKNRPPVANGDEPMINSTNIPLRKIFEPGAQPRQDPLQADPIPATPEPGSKDAAQSSDGGPPQ